MQERELIPHLFRKKYSKIIAVLCHSCDLRHLQIAEDIYRIDEVQGGGGDADEGG